MVLSQSIAAVSHGSLSAKGSATTCAAENAVYDNGFKEQWEMFIRHVCEDAPYKYTLLEGAKGVQLVECALQSWRERRWIDVPAITA